MHIAVWSGPRNLSTALMYSFGARSDFTVLDEPFYGAYLKETGLNHPMADQIIESMECDPIKVAKNLKPDNTPHLYSKQMTHHMIGGVSRDWFQTAHHVFLIRHPARVVASYAVKHDELALGDLGFQQQWEIFEQVSNRGSGSVVVDSADIRRSPQETLKTLCECLGLDWDPAMLSWSGGGHPADGVWAKHWYGAVHNSTGFADKEGPIPAVEPAYSHVCSEALQYYETLRKHAIAKE